MRLTNQEQRVLQKILQRSYDRMGLMAAAVLADIPEESREEQRWIFAIDNILRLIVGASLEAPPKFTINMPIEIALRAASIAISAGPESQQEKMVAFVADKLLEAHRVRMAQGNRITVDWNEGTTS